MCATNKVTIPINLLSKEDKWGGGDIIWWQIGGISQKSSEKVFCLHVYLAMNKHLRKDSIICIQTINKRQMPFGVLSRSRMNIVMAFISQTEISQGESTQSILSQSPPPECFAWTLSLQPPCLISVLWKIFPPVWVCKDPAPARRQMIRSFYQ